MPLGTYYEVTGSDPAALDIRRAAPIQREARPRVDDQDVPLMRDQYEQFRKEYDNALAILEARMKDIRPWETPEQLQAEIVKPVADKWQLVPGFGGALSGRASQMRADQDAKDAARQLTAQNRYETDFKTGVASGMTPTQAAMQAALKNSDLVFSGHAGALAGGAQAFRPSFDPAKAQFVEIPKTGHGYAQTESGWQIIPKGGEGAIAPLTRFQLNQKQDRLKRLQDQQDSAETLIPKEGQKVGPATQRLLDSYNKRQKEIDRLQQEIEQLLNEGRPASTATNALGTAAPKTFQSGKYRVTIK